MKQFREMAAKSEKASLSRFAGNGSTGAVKPQKNGLKTEEGAKRSMGDRAGGDRAEGSKPAARLDKMARGGCAEKYARGGRTKRGTHVNVIVAPQGQPDKVPVPVPVPAGAAPMAPRPMPPPGPAPGGPMPMAGPPVPGGPMPMRKSGGRVQTAGMESAKGRQERAAASKLLKR